MPVVTHTAIPAEVRILIVEDHPVVRLGLKNLLDAAPPLKVVAEVEDGLEVYAACQRHAPHIVLLDLGLPGMSGIDVIHQLRRRWSDLGIVVMTADTAEHRASAALLAGANGYVLKNSSQQVLLETLWKVWRGHTALDPALNAAQLGTPSAAPAEVALTPRERQVLKLIAEGCRNRDVAERLTITIKTVETHRLNLMRKLDAHNAADLTNWAHRLGLN
ncbi:MULTISPECIES: two component system response regulator [Burkholderia]|uniref:Two component system response regulator n=2 Tax=Burkholderia humptydooensis TaxID=430531 RepID=A0A7U4P4C2_9BURK|nr:MULTISPECIES: two component system response regulator [Burkholderia]AGK47220.1 bacterial regulatory s, luxR family protein [Burkholderia thailandensis MSMB121]ATF36959.1 DNA-binding response regulator [Burkholderia thailandensis]AJY43253.1 bacterial regulatory s, luxR family protein [Burkholderia sp. 2002721687]ALX42627.1 two-component system response regulator [Burkholderia humptydooensis]EIP87818.1 putative two-component response regulator, LuxR family protein [Burkholderia humptydooensis